MFVEGLLVISVSLIILVAASMYHEVESREPSILRRGNSKTGVYIYG